MTEVDVLVTLISNGNHQKFKTRGEYDEQKECLVMLEEQDIPTEVTVDFKRKTLTRVTEEYKIIIPFEKDQETKMTLELLKENQTLNLKIKTESYEYKKQKLVVKYQIIETKETIEYQIEF